MSAHFTPGPWKVSHDEYAGHYDVSTFDPERGSEAIAQVLYANNEPGGRGEADARLIAAAPALLEALGWLESYLRDTPHHNAPAAANARAAIALAKGEAK